MRQVGPPRSVTPKATGAVWTVVPPTMASGSGGWGCLGMGLGMGLGLPGLGLGLPGLGMGAQSSPCVGELWWKALHWVSLAENPGRGFLLEDVALFSQDGVGICRGLGWFSSGGSCHLGTKILLDFSISRLGYVKGSLIPAQGKAN